jgi:hypothetical protein
MHIPQESNSTSVLPGKSCRKREALIENSNATILTDSDFVCDEVHRLLHYTNSNSTPAELTSRKW